MPTVESVAPNLFVTDVARSVDWYVRVLGCGVAWQASDHAGVTLGPVTIVLARAPTAPSGIVYKSACHLRLGDGVDDFAAQIEAAGQSLAAPVRDRPEYGTREGCVRDPDGNDLYFAQTI